MKMPPDVRFNNKEYICMDMCRTNKKEPLTLTFSFLLRNVLDFGEMRLKKLLRGALEEIF